MGLIMQDDTISALYLDNIILPIMRGQMKSDSLCSSLGSALYAIPKPGQENEVLPAQGPDIDRYIAAALVTDWVLKKSPNTIPYFENGLAGTSVDPRISQRGFSSDGCGHIAKEIQLFHERYEVYDPMSIPPSRDNPVYAVIQTDITNFFPTVDRQAFLDMLAGIASKPYPEAGVNKGDNLPSLDEFQLLLPFATGVYGQETIMSHHFQGKDIETVKQTQGSSQGCPSGSICAAVALQLVLHTTAKSFPDMDFTALGIIDDWRFMGKVEDLAKVFIKFQQNLKDTLNVEINMPKSQLNLLQYHNIQDPERLLYTVFDQHPPIRMLKITTDGMNVAGIPVGHRVFIQAHLDEILGRLTREFGQCANIQNPQVFYLVVRASLNARIQHLLRGVDPQIMREYAAAFDELILETFGIYHKIDFSSIRDFSSSQLRVGQPIGEKEQLFLAKYQIREIEAYGGLNFASMEDTCCAAFLAANMKHIMRVVPEDIHGLTDPLFSSTTDPRYLSQQLRNTFDHFKQMGAIEVSHDRERHADREVKCFLPKSQIIFDNPTLTMRDIEPIKEVCGQLSNQKTVSLWYRQTSSENQRIRAFIKHSPHNFARLQHLSEQSIDGPHLRFSISSQVKIKYNPLAFMSRWMFDGYKHGSLSQHQFELVLKLILGLSPNDPATICKCQSVLGSTGAHEQNCKKWAAPSWKRGHDFVVEAVAAECLRLGFAVNTDEREMKKQSHLRSGKHADGLVQTNAAIVIRDQVRRSRKERDDFLFDVTVHAPMTTRNEWHGKFSADHERWEYKGLEDAEKAKYVKHEEPYASQDKGFLGFAVSTYPVLGPSLIRFLWVLAAHEAKQYADDLRNQGLPPIAPAILAQYQAQCFLASTSRTSFAVLKSAALRLSGTACIPAFRPPPRRHLARFRPSMADVAILAASSRGR
jgi:hypothetical protein